MMLVRQHQHFSSISSTWEPFSASSSHFDIIHVFRQEQSLFSLNKLTLPIRDFFPSKSRKNFLQLVFYTRSLQVGVRTKFRSRGTTGSSMLDHDDGHLCRGRRIHVSGHSDLEFFGTILELPPFLPYRRKMIATIIRKPFQFAIFTNKFLPGKLILSGLVMVFLKIRNYSSVW